MDRAIGRLQVQLRNSEYEILPLLSGLLHVYIDMNIDKAGEVQQKTHLILD